MNSTEGVHYIFDRYSFINGLLIEYFEKFNILKFAKGEGYCREFNTATGYLDFYLADADNEPLYDRPFGDAEDHEKFLILTPDSDAKDIKKAFKYVRMLYHPDRVASEGRRFREVAEQLVPLIEDAAKILLEESIRPAYNVRLLEFYKKDPALVSHSGNPILLLGANDDFFDLDSILNDKTLDTSQQEERIKQHVQFDEKAFETIRLVFKAAPENAQMKALYKDSLSRKLTYLELLEDVAWSKIGYTNKASKTSGNICHAEDYLTLVEEEISRTIAEDVPEAIAARNDALRIGVGKPVLLLTDQSADKAEAVSSLPSVMTAEMMQKLLMTAQSHMEERAEYVRDIAKQKQEVLEELVTLADLTPLNERDFSNDSYKIIVLQPSADAGEAPKFMMLLNLNVVDGNMAHCEKAHKFAGMAKDDALAQLSLNDSNVFLLLRNNEIGDMMLEPVGAADSLVAEWEAHHKNLNKKSDPTPPTTPEPS